MDNQQLVYNKEHITDISEKYSAAIREIDAIIYILNSTSGVKGALEDNYDGQAKDMTEELLTKISQHLNFLRSCCTNTRAYIKESLNTMIELDKAL